MNELSSFPHNVARQRSECVYASCRKNITSDDDRCPLRSNCLDISNSYAVVTQRLLGVVRAMAKLLPLDAVVLRAKHAVGA